MGAVAYKKSGHSRSRELFDYSSKGVSNSRWCMVLTSSKSYGNSRNCCLRGSGRKESVDYILIIVLRKISRAINGIIEQFPAGLELIIV